MRLDEIAQRYAEEQRVQRLKDTAQAAKEKARQLSAQANASADQLKTRKSRNDASRARSTSSTGTIKPHA